MLGFSSNHKKWMSFCLFQRNKYYQGIVITMLLSSSESKNLDVILTDKPWHMQMELMFQALKSSKLTIFFCYHCPYLLGKHE